MSQPLYDSLKRDIRAVLLAEGWCFSVLLEPDAGMLMMYDLLHIVAENRAFDDCHINFATGIWQRVLPFDGRPYSFYEGECDAGTLKEALFRMRDELVAESVSISA